MSPFLHDHYGKVDVTLSLLSLQTDEDVALSLYTWMSPIPVALPLRGPQPSRVGVTITMQSHHLVLGVTGTSPRPHGHYVPAGVTVSQGPCRHTESPLHHPSYPGVGTESGGTAPPPARARPAGHHRPRAAWPRFPATLKASFVFYSQALAWHTILIRVWLHGSADVECIS